MTAKQLMRCMSMISDKYIDSADKNHYGPETLTTVSKQDSVLYTNHQPIVLEKSDVKHIGDDGHKSLTFSRYKVQ